MKNLRKLFLTIICIFETLLLSASSDDPARTLTTGKDADRPDPGTLLCIGQSEKAFLLDHKTASLSGLAYGENESGNCLFMLDRTNRQILVYSITQDTEKLVYLKTIPLKRAKLTDPRGLVYSREKNADVFYFLDYGKIRNATISRLYRYDTGGNDLTYVDLTDGAYELGVMEVFGLARQNDNLFLSFNPGGYSDQVARMRRGIISFSVSDNDDLWTTLKKRNNGRPSAWEKALAGQPVISKHLPGPGKAAGNDNVEASLALAAMNIDGHEYMWGTIGSSHIYLIDSKTGRGVFFFDMPGSKEGNRVYHSGVAFGAGHLWAAEPGAEEPVVHRINVLENLDVPFAGPKRFREIRMRLTSVIKDKVSTPRGLVFHTFLHPFPEGVLGRQGVIPNTLHVNDLTGVSDCNTEHLFLNPGNDPASRQDFTLVTYSADLHPDIRKYETDFGISVWMREYKHFIYPHLVKGDSGPEGTTYLEDDDILFKYKENPEIYKAFIQRVKDYIFSEYGIEPEMENPYWAARNITEYVKENYHYPKDEEGFFATYDFEKGNFNSNPGNLKAELSADNNYIDNIIACSGTGAMLCGALRFIGIPATWIGVSQEQNWDAWNTEDKDEFLEFNEESAVGNGHRYNHVWLGEFYGWQRFDATPTRPDGVEFDKKPKEVSQWDLMLKSASGVEPRRVIHTIQSEFWANLHNAFADCEEHVNNCGATRYNLLGTYTYPEDFNLSRNTIRYRAILFVNNVRVLIDGSRSAAISWDLTGDWHLDPEARVDIILEKKDDRADNSMTGYKQVYVIKQGIPVGQTLVETDFRDLVPGSYRVKVVKTGDPSTGNARCFELD
jgi:hypothetical protein